MKTFFRSGAPFAALLAAFPLFSPDEARAQAAVCTPTQTVSGTADADGVYTTTLVCADTSAAAGEADYRQLHYNHGVAVGLQNRNQADRDTTLANNNANNHLSLTLGSGVVFTADGYGDLRTTSPDGAIVLTRGGAKTVVVQDGAVINLERTPTFWSATDPNRPASATSEYDPAWYPAWRDALDNLTAIAAHSYTNEGDADIMIELDGVINTDIAIGGTYGKPTSTNPYHTSGGRAIDVQVKDNVDDGARADIDVLIDVGATGAIRHVDGTDGLAGIYAENFSEDGDITVNLAEGSVVDVSEGGGYGITAYMSAHSNNEGQRTGDITINAAGTIRAATRNRSISFQQGIGVFATSGVHNGRVRITSSGTIETVQGAAIEARAWRDTNTYHDDPDTAEIEGHLIDVAGGTVETRGTTAIYASTGSVNAAMTVRSAEGATVRAQALTDEDYENGAITRRNLGPNGNSYIISTPYRFYGYRQVREGTALEPIITAIVVRDFSSAAAAEGVRDQVLVDGTVEAIGGKADVDPAIWMEGGGLVVVGASGRVSADSGLAIEGGCVSEYRTSSTVATTDCDSKPERDLAVTVAGTVEGDIRLRGDGDLTATVAGTVDGDIRTMGSGSLTLSVAEGGAVTGTVHDPVGPLTVAGGIGRLLYTNGGTVTVAGTGSLTGVEVDDRTEALRSEAGDLDLTVAGRVAGDVRVLGGGDLDATVSGTLTGDVFGSGAGEHTITVSKGGTVAGDIRATGRGTLTVSVAEGGAVTGTVHDPVGPLTVAGDIGRLLYTNGGTVTVAGTGSLTGVEVDRTGTIRSGTGSVVESAAGTEALRSEAGDLNLTVAGRVTGDVRALGAGRQAGRHTVAVSKGGTVDGDIRTTGSLTLSVAEGGAVTGTVHDPVGPLTVAGGIGRLLYTNGGTVTVAGTGSLTGVEAGGRTEALRSEAGDLDLTVAGRVAGDVRVLGGGDLDATVSGTLAGDVFGSGAGEHTVTVSKGGTVDGDIRTTGSGPLAVSVAEGGAVTGTVHDPVDPLTVAGGIGRLLYTNGGTVTVAGTGSLTGVAVDGGTEALRSEAGDLDLTVAGRVAGDVRASGDGDLDATVSGTLAGDVFGSGAGEHTVTVSKGGTVDGDIRTTGPLAVSVAEGGAVTGTVRDPVGPLTVVGGIGRLLYTNGGTVTVAGAGSLTGVEVDGGTEALRSEAGNLNLTVAGRVAGDVRALGAGERAGRHTVAVSKGGTVDGDIRTTGPLTVSVAEGGAVTGTVRDPVGPLTVVGGIGRLLYTNGGTVTVAGAGSLTGVGTEALRSEAGDLDLTVAGRVTGDVRALGDGDLDATVSGTLTGDVFGSGAGEHTVTVSDGGTVTGTVHLSASTVTVDGAAGRVRFDNGGMVTVGGTGRITGVEVDGRTEAIRNQAGELVVESAGMIVGDIIDSGARPAKVTIRSGSTVAGVVDLGAAGSEVTAGGAVEQVRLPEGGMVTVGPSGKVGEQDSVGISSDRGELVVVVQHRPGETPGDAFERAVVGSIVEKDAELTIQTQKEGERPSTVVAPDAMSPAPDGTDDVGVERTETGGIRVVRRLAPRARMYEALPSVLLGLNRLPEFRDRMDAPRAANRAGWARVETFRDKWKAAESSTPGLEYDHRRTRVKAGMDIAVSEHGLFGVSFHHRRGKADVSAGGDVKLVGLGVGVSGAWLVDDVGYVDVQAEATRYKADFTSASRGVLKTDAAVRGHALGVEAGRRFAIEDLPAGMVLTPRAGLAYSKVSAGDFTDAVGAHVSLEDGRSLKGRAGMVVEVEPGPRSRVFGSVDVEREFWRHTKVVVSGTELRSEAKATWVRLGLNGAHAWDEGRYAVQGEVRYATSGGGGHEFGGGLHLKMRF